MNWTVPSSAVQALILAGGEGTRLRPLTSAAPKPVVPLVDRPFIVFMLEWLRGHGVDDVVMSLGNLADGVRDVLGDGESVGMRLRYVEEPRPLGTGGALKFAEDLLDERFLMLNGDVLTDIDVTAQLRAHEASGARATLALYPVEDPSAYGLVRLNADDSVREFVEKPAPDQIDTNNISAGVYVLEKTMLQLLAKGEPASIERDVFPELVGQRAVRPRLAPATGRTSGRPSATWRRPSTSSRARSRPRWPSGWARRSCSSTTTWSTRGGSCPRPWWSPAAGSAAGARIGGRAVLEHGVTVGARHDDRGRRRDAGRDDRRRLHDPQLHHRRGRARSAITATSTAWP